MPINGIFQPLWMDFSKMALFSKNPSLEMKFIMNSTIFNQNFLKNHQFSTDLCIMHIGLHWRGVNTYEGLI